MDPRWALHCRQRREARALGWDAVWPLLVLTAWVALLFSPLYFRLEVAWPSPPGAQSVKLCWLLGPIRVRVPSRRGRAQPENVLVSFGQFRAMLALLRDLDRLVDSIRDVEGEVEVGTGDPAGSAILSGVAWGLWGTAVDLLRRRIPVEPPPRMAIAPRYGQGGVAVRLSCILRTRGVHLIRVAPTLNVLGGRQNVRRDVPHGQRDAPHHGKPERDGGRQHHPGGARRDP